MLRWVTGSHNIAGELRRFDGCLCRIRRVERVRHRPGGGVLEQGPRIRSPIGRSSILAPESGDSPRLHLDENDRTHLDLWVDRQGSDLQTEVERLISLGARRVDWDYPEDADFVVLADTEGNVFCVIA